MLNEAAYALRRCRITLDDVERFIRDVRTLVTVLPLTTEVHGVVWRIIGCAYAYANGIGTMLSEDM